jgi:hypothetical protein
LFDRITMFNRRAPLQAFVGGWRHSAEMRATCYLPVALARFGLLPKRFATCPPGVRLITPSGRLREM